MGWEKVQNVSNIHPRKKRERQKPLPVSRNDLPTILSPFPVSGKAFPSRGKGKLREESLFRWCLSHWTCTIGRSATAQEKSIAEYEAKQKARQADAMALLAADRAALQAEKKK